MTGSRFGSPGSKIIFLRGSVVEAAIQIILNQNLLNIMGSNNDNNDNDNDNNNDNNNNNNSSNNNEMIILLFFKRF